MRIVLFQNIQMKMSEAAIIRIMLSRNRCPSNPILDFDNKLMKGTKKFCKFIEDTSEGVQFYKAAALQPKNLPKRALLLKKILIFMLQF